MKKPLVSVVVPTFNRDFCIAETLKSALQQTHQELEILVIDDGSTDNTEAVVGDLARSDDRINYVYQENKGVSAARNHALRLSTGDYIAFLDSDDIWKPWKIELQLDCFNRFPELGMIWTDMEAIDANGQLQASRYLRTMYSAYTWYPTEELFPHSSPLSDISSEIADVVADNKLYYGDIFSQMIVGNLVHTSTVLMNRDRLEKVGEFCEEMLKGGEDYQFHLMTCREGLVALADIPSIQYRIGMNDQITGPSSNIHFARSYLKTISGVLEHDQDRLNLSEGMIQKILAEAHDWIGSQAFEEGFQHEAREHLFKSLACKSWQPHVMALLLRTFIPSVFEQKMRGVYRGMKSCLVRN